MDAHDQETQKQESRAADRWGSKLLMSETAGIEMHNAPIRAAEKQLITTEHHAYKITHDQSTSSPEEDYQYAVETSRSTSHVTTSWDKRKNLALIVIRYDE